jgi:hypothetical protein
MDINVAPKRGLGEMEKLYRDVQEKTPATGEHRVLLSHLIWKGFFSLLD